MNYPRELLYSKSHEWVLELDGTTAQIGITDYAQQELGDLVFVSLPEVGDEALAGERIADLESVKAVSEIYSPVTGTVRSVNAAIADSPERINEDPYGSWLFVIEGISDREELLDADEYENYCEKED
jgi:glycine cleavage system H protein